MNLAKRLYYGRFGVEASSRLANPLVKTVVLIVPIFIFIFQTLARTVGWTRLSLVELICISTVFYSCANLALSGSKFPTFVRRMAWFLGLIAIFLLAAVPLPAPLTKVAELVSHTFHRVHTFSGVSLETWILLSLLASMHAAARNITTRDALWIGRTFLWRGPLFAVYTVVIVVHAVLGSVLPLRLTSSWQSAISKARLGRNKALGTRRGFILNASGTFATNLIGNNASIGISIASLIRQRGMFRRGRGDPAAGNPSAEDRMAIVLIVLLVLVCTLYRLPFTIAAH
ncbi:MAG TPA: hypothetical protein VEA61_10415 [Allosphingosinicella sp.]|nr:hypothetical protein [Allosphingosinicella sp.]